MKEIRQGIIDVGWHMGRPERPKKADFCVPVYPDEPYPQMMEALNAEIPFLEKGGWGSEVIYQKGLPYISASRALLLHSALKADATAIMFIDQDISWEPGSAVRLLETEGGFVCGAYRFKHDDEHYMGGLREISNGVAARRDDGCLEAYMMPAGFMKVTREAINQMIKAHPELCCGEPCSPHFDLFSHGVIEGEWRGEDAAACIRWWQMGEKVWCLPDLNITHHSKDKDYPGNLAKFLKAIVGNPVTDLGKFHIRSDAA
jgi:hypothetical protein